MTMSRVMDIESSRRSDGTSAVPSHLLQAGGTLSLNRMPASGQERTVAAGRSRKLESWMM